jgi:hypothetical protein
MEVFCKKWLFLSQKAKEKKSKRLSPDLMTPFEF